MTNAEKYLKEGVGKENFMYVLAYYLFKNLGYYSGTQGHIIDTIGTFFEQEVKPTLTEDERVILRNIQPEKLKDIEEFKIERNNSDLWLVTKGICTDVTRNGNEIKGEAHTPLHFYNHLFQFIKERRRIRDKGAVE